MLELESLETTSGDSLALRRAADVQHRYLGVGRQDGPPREAP